MKLILPQQTYPLRHKVLRPHQPIEACQYPGDEDEGTFHLAAFDQNQIVSIVSFYQEGHPEVSGANPYRFRGMATDPAYQGQGLGSELLKQALEEAKKRGADVVWCNAREVAFSFYEQLGLHCIGELFEIEGIGPHKVMVKRI